MVEAEHVLERGRIVSRYLVDVRFRWEPASAVLALEPVLESLAEALAGRRDLVDPDVGACFGEGWIEVTAAVDAPDDVTASQIAVKAIGAACSTVVNGIAAVQDVYREMAAKVRPAEVVP
jgi:hypothetical protein